MIDLACKPAAFGYTRLVPETTGTEIGVSKLQLADNRRTAVFFRPSPCVRLQWSGLGVGALALAGFQLRRYANHVMRPATTIGVVGRVPNPATGGCIMRQALARPEQTNQSDLQQFINAALRDATNAQTIFRALDALADALRTLADLSKEVRHA